MAGGQQISSAQGNVTASGGTIVLSGIASTVGQGFLSGTQRGQQFLALQGDVAKSLTLVPSPGNPYEGTQLISTGQGTLTPQSGERTLTGISIASASGTVYPSGNNVTVNITGIDFEFSTGFIAYGGQLLSGIATTGALGSYALSNTLPITGIAVTCQQESVGVSQDADDTYITSSHGNSIANADVPLTGSESVTGQGTLTITGDITLALTGEAVTSAQEPATFAFEFPLTGQSMTAAQYPFGAPGTAALTGSQVAVQQNDMYTTDDRTYALTGQGMVISDGNAVTSYLAFATGQELSVQQQGIGPRTVDLVGQLINAYQQSFYVDKPQRDAGRGKGKGKGRKDDQRGRLLVQIDDEEFEVSSQEEAEALLEAARSSAVELAAAQAKTAIDKRVQQARDSGKALDVTPISLDMPSVMSSDEEFKRQLDETIAAVYKRAEIDAEIAVHLAKQRLLDEEDNVVLLLIS